MILTYWKIVIILLLIKIDKENKRIVKFYTSLIKMADDISFNYPRHEGSG